MKSRIGMAVCSVLMAALCVSCFDPKDFDMDRLADTGLEYDIAMPLTETRLTIENLIDLQGGVFVPDESGLLHIVYGMEPVAASLIEDVQFGESLPFDFGCSDLPYFCRDTVFTFPFSDTLYIDMDGVPDGTVMKELYLSSARMDISFYNGFIFPLSVDLALDNVSEGSGSSVSVQENLGPGARDAKGLELNNVRIRLDEDHQPCILVSGRATVRMDSIPGDSILHYGGFGVQSTFGQMQFHRIDGYMASTPYTIRGDMSMAGLGLERMTNINFEKATVIADIRVEGVSAPIRIESADVRIHNQTAYASVPLFPANYDIDYPDINAPEMVRESRQTTAAEDFLVDRPNGLSYELKGRVNPDQDKEVLQAIRDGSELAVGLSCDIPVWFSAEQYALRDTMDVSLEQLDDATSFSYFDIKTILKNAFPLEVVVSLHFLDADYNELFTLFHEKVAESGKVGPAPDYHVIEPVISNFEDELDALQLMKAKQLRYIVVDAKISTTDAETVKIYMASEDESFIDVKVGIRAKIAQKGLFE